MADTNGAKKRPDFFLCVAEVTDKEREARVKTYPQRIAAVWHGVKDGVEYYRCGRLRHNVLLTRNSQIVLFENTAQETVEEPEDDGTPF
jgi:hypothetical protein